MGGRYREQDRSSVAPHCIHVPRSSTEVVVESLGDFEDALDMFHGEWGSLVDGEGLGCADGVFDL